MKPIESQFNKTAIVELYNTVDLIGISSYAGKQDGIYGRATASVCLTVDMSSE
jgi:hypothetical protein